MKDKPLHTVDHITKRLGVTRSTVYRLARTGVLPGFKVGNQWRFSEELLEEWVREKSNCQRVDEEPRQDKNDSNSGNEAAA
jgi:excisionase family DNA binding protein